MQISVAAVTNDARNYTILELPQRDASEVHLSGCDRQCRFHSSSSQKIYRRWEFCIACKDDIRRIRAERVRMKRINTVAMLPVCERIKCCVVYNRELIGICAYKVH